MKPILAASILSLSACAGPPVVTASSSACSSLIPPDWAKGVEGAPLPEGNVLADWIAFGDAQTGKLDQANSRTKDAIGIVERCETRDRQSIERATKGFLGRIFG